MAEIERKIRVNEAKLKALEGVRLYTDKNKIVKLTSNHIDELT